MKRKPIKKRAQKVHNKVQKIPHSSLCSRVLTFTMLMVMLASFSLGSQLIKPVEAAPEVTLASRSMSLEKRYPVESVNKVFKDNILLNLAYMRGTASKGQTQNWDVVTAPFSYELVLEPNETFAFHDDVNPAYSGTLKRTTNAHFNAQEGFKFSGMYYGDGVCHLASLIYWAAKDANLDAKAPTNHDFRAIPEVPREYGVSIFSMPGAAASNQAQNLYVTNSKKKPVALQFSFDGENLKVAVIERI